jgi:hypothetical protein
MGRQRKNKPSQVTATSPATEASAFRWGRWLVGAALVIALGAVLWYYAGGGRHGGEAGLGDDLVDDPRLTYAGPFRNVHPAVKYLGDTACVGCHKEVSHSFHQHSMGRSIVPVRELVDKQHLDAAHHNPFKTPTGREYVIERKGDQVIHKEIFRDAAGKVLAETEVPIEYVIGSGAHAHSYLFRRGEHVFQSPITWFSQKQRWDLSPGYERLEDVFSRPARGECLFCHTHQASEIPGSMGKYSQPVFPQGTAIGCERCHGPGEIHARERQQNLPVEGEIDYTIVNSRHLELPLREAVCQQCHLEGSWRVLRRGREAFDFRPGLPLHPFYSTFVFKPGVGETSTFVGHFEQMHQSKCYTKSQGRMDCVTCHDPHVPVAQVKPDFYRNTCINCHQDRGCSVPEFERRAKNLDNCVACHMPKEPTLEVRHTAITNHAIPRRGDPRHRHPSGTLKPGEAALLYFHADFVKPDDPEVQRDLGIAQSEVVRYRESMRGQLAGPTKAMLEASLQRWPNDIAAREGLAFLQNTSGDPRGALATIEAGLARWPRREFALGDAASYASDAGDLDQALSYARRVKELNPWMIAWRERLVEIHLQRKEYEAALTECREVLSFNPGSVRIRALLAAALVRSGKVREGEAEFETALQMNPANKQELRTWFDQLRHGR